MDPLTGALIGSAVTGGLGAIGGYFEGEAKKKAARNAREDLDKGWQTYSATQQGNLRDLDAILSQYDPQKYASMVENAYTSGKGQYQAGQFTPADVNQWLAPDIDYRIQRATTAIENSAAGKNKLLSGATQKSISDRAQQVAQEAYDKALTAGQNAFNANESAKQAQASSQQNAISNILSIYNPTLSAKTGFETQKMQIGQNLADQSMNYAGARSNTRTGTNTWATAFSGGLQGITPWASAVGQAAGQKPTGNQG